MIVGWREAGLRLRGDVDLTGHLPDFFTPQPTSLGDVVLTRTGDTLTVDLPGDEFAGPVPCADPRAAASLVELAVVSRLVDVAVVHAGVVALDDRVVLLPGPSMTGKSTLVHALVADGFTYLSDEYAIVHPDGAVSAYPRPMTLRPARERVVPAGARRPDRPPLPVGLILSLAHTGTSELAPVPAAGAALDLLGNAVNGRRSPAGTVSALAALARSARAFTGTRGDAAATVPLVRRLLDG